MLMVNGANNRKTPRNNKKVTKMNMEKILQNLREKQAAHGATHGDMPVDSKPVTPQPAVADGEVAPVDTDVPTIQPMEKNAYEIREAKKAFFEGYMSKLANKSYEDTIDQDGEVLTGDRNTAIDDTSLDQSENLTEAPKAGNSWDKYTQSKYWKDLLNQIQTKGTSQNRMAIGGGAGALGGAALGMASGKGLGKSLLYALLGGGLGTAAGYGYDKYKNYQKTASAEQIAFLDGYMGKEANWLLNYLRSAGRGLKTTGKNIKNYAGKKVDNFNKMSPKMKAVTVGGTATGGLIGHKALTSLQKLKDAQNQDDMNTKAKITQGENLLPDVGKGAAGGAALGGLAGAASGAGLSKSLLYALLGGGVGAAAGYGYNQYGRGPSKEDLKKAEGAV